MEEFDDIVVKVSSIYQKYGIKSVTMDDVARELGVSKKTLYSFVTNKEELVEKFIAYQMHERKRSVNKVFSEGLNAIDELLEVNKHVIEMLKSYNPATEYDLRKYYPHLYSKLRVKRMENMYNAILRNIEKGKAEGLFRAELKSEIIARVHVSRIESGFSSEVFSIEELTSEQFVNEMMIYHIRGIANSKGIELLENRILTNNKENNE